MKVRLGESYAFESRGPVEIKGKEAMETWFLTGRAELEGSSMEAELG